MLKPRLILLSLLFIFTCGLNKAAGPPPGGSPPGAPSGAPGSPGCWPPPCIPVDGGIALLIAAGLVYGSRALAQKGKKRNNTSE